MNQRHFYRLLSIVLIAHLQAFAQNPERTIELPGGAKMEMVWIPSGAYTMGSPDSELGRWPDEKQRDIVIDNGFWFGKYEITQAQWVSVMNTMPWSGLPNSPSDPNKPAMRISWEDIQEFIQQLNISVGDSLYRLPHEAEWEYAARAGTTTRWSFGDDESQLKEYAWYSENTRNVGLEYAQPVGTKRPNPWGLFDMHGNLFEWCQDSPVFGGNGRALRGGSWFDDSLATRSAQRFGSLLTFRSSAYGARLLNMGPMPTSVSDKSWGQIKNNIQ